MWANYTRHTNQLINTEYKKVSKKDGKWEEDCREMSEERILEMLSSDSLKSVKSVAKTCNVTTSGSKIDIIMRIKRSISKDTERFKKVFSKLWGHSGGWLTFSCPHGIVYYLKFLLRAESCRDYIDGCLSMLHMPNVVVVDMAHMIARHANGSRRNDVKKYNMMHLEICSFPMTEE